MADWLDGLYLAPKSITHGGVGFVVSYMALHLLFVRDGSRATRLLGLMLGAAAVNAITMALWYASLVPTIALPISGIALKLVGFFEVLFVYHFLRDDTPRERRIATIVMSLLLAVGVGLHISFAFRDAAFYSAPQWASHWIEMDPEHATASSMFMTYRTTFVMLGFYGWALVVLFRKCARFEREAGASLFGALLRPQTWQGRAARAFALLSIVMVLLPVVVLVTPGVSPSVFVLFVACAFMWVHVNNSTEPTRLRFKLVSLPLAGVIGIQCLAFTPIAKAAQDEHRDLRSAEASRLATLVVERQDVEGSLSLSEGDVHADVRFVISYPSDGPTYPMEVATHFQRGTEVDAVLESNRLDQDYRRLFAPVTYRRFDPSLSEEAAQKRAVERLASGEMARIWRADSWTFYGSFLPPSDRYIVARWESGDRMYEAGWSEFHRRRHVHAAALPLLLVVLATGTFLVAGLPLLLRRRVLGPVADLMEGVRRVEAGDLTTVVTTRSTDELGILTRSFYDMVGSVRVAREQLEEINAAAFRFVPRPFLKQLGHESILDVRLGQQQAAHMTVLFADVRDFTSLSERMTPDETFVFVNALLDGLGPVIRAHGGFIDKYMGDAVMALFPRSPDDAVAAAVALRGALAAFNGRRAERGEEPIRLGIGLHTGDLMLGIIGEAERLEGTVIADVVNTASRLEGLTKRYRAGILISGETREGLSDRDALGHRFVERVQVKGRAGAIDVYEVFDGDPPEMKAAKAHTAGDLQLGWELLVARRFDEAADAFRAVLQRSHGDPVAEVHLERARTLARDPPPDDWDGVVRMDGK